MRNKIITLISMAAGFLSLPISAHGQPPMSGSESSDMSLPLNLSTPEEAVLSLFRAMYLGDSSLIDEIYLEDAQFRRVTASGEVKSNWLEDWRNWVGEQNEGDAVEEIFALQTQEFGHLAAVWAPFVLTYKGKITNCGVNQFTLVKAENQWRIIFGIDTAASPDTDCATFKEEYQNS
ncbi:MAG: hypothetical protein AAF603_11210 [Pseudomonadota bacterium]